jgi:hypothetical protein
MEAGISEGASDISTMGSHLILVLTYHMKTREKNLPSGISCGDTVP